MKKKLAILLVLTIAIGLLSGCVAISDEKLVINVVYAKSAEESAIDPAEDAAAKEVTAIRDSYLLGGKSYFCGGKDYSDRLAEAAKDADIVICVGEELKDLTGVAASNKNARWIWVGGDEALSSDMIYVIPADAEITVLFEKIKDFVEGGLSDDYVWATAKEAVSTEQTAGE